MGELQERITSTKAGAITSVQAVYVPADDPTDPAPANTFQHLDAFIYLERSIAARGIYPAIDPLASNSRILVAEPFTGKKGNITPLSETIRSFEEICDGKHDNLP